MILKSAFEDSKSELHYEGDPGDEVGACLIIVTDESEYGSCALSKDSAKQLAEALLEFANRETD